MQYLWYYLLIINAAGFMIMLTDKRKAQKGAWRIPETMLMTIAAIGGSLGSLIGIYTVRHKTRHPKFTIGVPALLAVHVILLVALVL